MKEAAQPYDSDARSVMNEQKKKKKGQECGELGATGRWGTSNCVMYRCYNLQHQTACHGDDATGRPRQKRQVVGDDMMIQAQNKYSKVTPQTMRTG